MNLENFTEFLRYPSRLYQLSYEELKSLSLQYPYCANLHVLLLVKSKLEGHPDLKKNLHRAATYAIDRRRLRLLLEDEQLLSVDSSIPITTDEVLELQNLLDLELPEKVPVSTSDPEEDKQLILPQPGQDLPYSDLPLPEEEGENSVSELLFSPPAAAGPAEELPPLSPLPTVPAEDIAPESDGIPDAAADAGERMRDLVDNIMTHVAAIPLILPALPETLPFTVGPAEEIPAYELVKEDIERAATLVDIALTWTERSDRTIEWELEPERSTAGSSGPSESVRPVSPAPLPKSAFNSYRQRYRPPLSASVDANARRVAPARRRTAPVQQVVTASVQEDHDIASETLAELLVSQLQYEKAIKMYEQLSLLIPQKSAYFAAKIDAIKNK